MMMNTHHNEERKNFRLDEVLTKCRFREECTPKSNSLAECNEIKTSFLAHAWNEENPEQPIFVKLMLRVGYHLGIPSSFSRRYLPVEDTMITLQTESGHLYKAKYLPRKLGLSAGWAGFTYGEKLVQGDLVVFHLIETTKFKVYITRQGSSTVRLPPPLNLYKEGRQCDLDDNQLIANKRRKVRQSREKSNKRDPDENRSNTFEVKVQFNNIKGFEDFSTVISELLQKDPLPELLLREYYDLCRAQKAFLHAHLFKGLKNPEVFDIKSTISETVSIGIAIRTSTPFTFLNKFSVWSKMLTYYEDIGMNVSLLNSRLHHLLNLAIRSDAAIYRSRYIEACRERTHCECETKKLEMILAKLKKVHVLLASEVKVLESKAGWKYTEAYFRFIQAKDEIREIEGLIADFGKFFEHYDTVIETLKLKANKHEPQFQEEAEAPW